MKFFDDLSDSELRRRLSQRGLAPEMVEFLIANRNTADGHRRIVEELGL